MDSKRIHAIFKPGQHEKPVQVMRVKRRKKLRKFESITDSHFQVNLEGIETKGHRCPEMIEVENLIRFSQPVCTRGFKISSCRAKFREISRHQTAPGRF